jgi:cobaltochelatase CobN
MWNEFYDVYVLDKYDLGLDEWFQEENPWASQSMDARMLEAVRKGYWDASDEVVQNLVKEYVESVVQDGVTCCHHTCGNPTLDSYVQGIMSVPGVIDKDTMDEYNRLMKEATHRETPVSRSSSHSSSGATASASIMESANNQTSISDAGYGMTEQATQQNTPDNYVEGYEMTKESINSEESASSTSFSGADVLGSLLVVLAVGVIAIGFRKQRI